MKKVEYRTISEVYNDELSYIWSDNEVIKYTNIKKPCSNEAIDERVARFKKHDVFVVKEDGHVIGVIGCPCIDKNKGEYGIFYQFRKSVWGRGIATKAAEWLIKYMKDKYNNLTIYADVVADNVASDKILNKLGFVWVNDDIDAFQRDGHKMTIKNYKYVI